MSTLFNEQNLPIGSETVFKKKDAMRIVFSDEKMFGLDGIYNSQNDRIWVVNGEEANREGETKNYDVTRSVFRRRAPLVDFGKGPLEHHRYITMETHAHKETQKWYSEHFPPFLGENTWPANSPN